LPSSAPPETSAARSRARRSNGVGACRSRFAIAAGSTPGLRRRRRSPSSIWRPRRSNGSPPSWRVTTRWSSAPQSRGEAFVGLVDKTVRALESIPPDRRPLCWFLAGAALLALDATGRRGVDLPKVRDTYWPHRKNFERLQRSALDWRLLCPGPMVDEPALGLARLRVSIDSLPTPLPAMARSLPAPLVLPLFAMKIAEMIIPYADAASVMLANLQPGDAMSRHRIGIALPAGMKGRKPQWAARPRDA
jgi:hypothetical protein